MDDTKEYTLQYYLWTHKVDQEWTYNGSVIWQDACGNMVDSQWMVAEKQISLSQNFQAWVSYSKFKMVKSECCIYWKWCSDGMFFQN